IGRLPFESEALGDLLVKIIVAPVPVPSQVGRVPQQFDRWWARATDRDPSRRFPSAKEFADSLALVLGQSAVTDARDRPQMAAGTAVMPRWATTPQPSTTPNPNPNPMMGTPQLANTPNPMPPQHMSPGYGPPPMMMPQQSTGAPLSRTFGTDVPGVPK